MSCLKAAALALILSAGTASANPEFWKFEWPNTDFEITTIESWAEVLSGGPPKDGIPAVDDPQFIPIAEETEMDRREPVITVALEGEIPRAYPIRYLTWHEIVNDRIGDIPVSITFCPLCNSAIAFDGRVDGQVLTFGVTGKLRNSDMIMYDRQTESWWQQALGTGIVGEMTGVDLKMLPSWMESWEQFKEANPDGIVMAQPPFYRRYGQNPYYKYDSNERPFFYNGENPPFGISPISRVVRVGERAWPLARLAEAEMITEAGVTLSWRKGQASALDQTDFAISRDVGSVRVQDGQGNDVPHDVLFAFAFHAFWPEGEWMLGE